MSEAPSRPGPEAPVALDAQGADGGPAVAIEVARIAAASGIAVRLFGPASLEVPEGVELVPCEDAIGNEVEPVAAVRSTPDASVVRAAADVAEGRSGALVSAGSTGAAMTAALFALRRIKGVHRPALAVQVPLPGTSGRTLLFLDCGANTEARPQHLIQFAHLGAAFSESVLGIERPRVGLLSVGEEQKKGRPDVVEANAALREAGGIEFVGNVEGRDLLTGVADVIVTDGFTGNVALKTLEGTARAVADAVRAAARSNPIAMAGGALMRPALGQLREAMDPNAVGGAILLGLNGVAVVAHGSSSPEGIAPPGRRGRRSATAAPRPPVTKGRSARPAGRDNGADGPGRSHEPGARPPRRRARGRTRSHHARDPLPRGPRRGLARPLRARDGAGGPLWNPRQRGRGRGAPHRRRRGGLRRGPRAGWVSGRPQRSLAELLAELPDELAAQAFSHSSWVPRRTEGYGRLAFLGDSVLGLAVASRLFGELADADIGELTKIHNQAVSGRACAEVARRLGFAERLHERAPGEGAGVPAETLIASERTMASICEAVIGACYLAHGFEATAAAVVGAFAGEIDQARSERLDFKSELQERLARDGTTVSYEVVREAGPPHDRTFDVRATVSGDELGAGSGRSKKEAEQAAAERALERLR